MSGEHPLQQVDLVARQIGVPDVDDQNHSPAGTRIPDFVHKAVVEDEAAALLPRSRDATYSDAASARYLEPEMATQSRIRRAAVRCDSRAGCEAREIRDAGALDRVRVTLDDRRGDGTADPTPPCSWFRARSETGRSIDPRVECPRLRRERREHPCARVPMRFRTWRARARRRRGTGVGRTTAVP